MTAAWPATSAISTARWKTARSFTSWPTSARHGCRHVQLPRAGQAARVLVAAKRPRAACGRLAGEGRRDPRAALSRTRPNRCSSSSGRERRPRPGRGHDARRPSRSPVRASLPSPKIVVVKAIYGVPGDEKRTRDVTAKVQKLIDAGTTSFTVAEMAQRRRSGVERREDAHGRVHRRRQAAPGQRHRIPKRSTWCPTRSPTRNASGHAHRRRRRQRACWKPGRTAASSSPRRPAASWLARSRTFRPSRPWRVRGK